MRFLWQPRLVRCWIAAVFAMAAAVAQERDAPEETRRPQRGDTVHLKGGGTIHGVQVLRATAFVVELQTLPHLPPLPLAKSQVTRIDYDDFDPAAWEDEDVTDGTSGAAEVVMGTRLSREFDRKLFAPLPENRLVIQDADFVPLLIELARELEIPLNISDSVRAIPKEERRWTAETQPGTSFITLLREHLSASFPKLRIVFNYDNVTLTMRAETPQAP